MFELWHLTELCLLYLLRQAPLVWLKHATKKEVVLYEALNQGFTNVLVSLSPIIIDYEIKIETLMTCEVS